MAIIRFFENSDELNLKRGSSGGSAGLESFTREWPDNKRERDALLLGLLKDAPKINTTACRFSVVGGYEEPLASGAVSNGVVSYIPQVELKDI